MRLPIQQFQNTSEKLTQNILEAQDRLAVEDLLGQVLWLPIEDILGRPRKAFRARLVEMGFELASPTIPGDDLKKVASQIIEMLHAGSLVIDDIQDGSRLRRGLPTLHETYGVPVAINAGNYLYFWPLELASHLPISAETKLRILEDYHKTLLKAHLGQGIDVGIPTDSLPQDRVNRVYRTIVRLKSGALTAFAMKLGATLAHASEETINLVYEYGLHFGVALQQFDDIGNFVRGDSPEKHLEDFRLRRPSHVWATAAATLDKKRYEEFLGLVRHLPHSRHNLMLFAERTGLILDAIGVAAEDLQGSLQTLMKSFPHAEDIHTEIRQLNERLENAYV